MQCAIAHRDVIFVRVKLRLSEKSGLSKAMEVRALNSAKGKDENYSPLSAFTMRVASPSVPCARKYVRSQMRAQCHKNVPDKKASSENEFCSFPPKFADRVQTNSD